MKLLAQAASAEAEYACPMHPEVVSNTADKCPKCGMKLVPANLVGQTLTTHITNTPSMTTSTVTTAKATPTRRLKGSNGKTTCSRSTG